MDLPKRWERKPLPDQTCDSSVGWHTDQLGAPVIDMCGKLAVETVLTTKYRRWVYLCEGHRDHYVETGQAIRNPKRRPGRV